MPHGRVAIDGPARATRVAYHESSDSLHFSRWGGVAAHSKKKSLSFVFVTCVSILPPAARSCTVRSRPSRGLLSRLASANQAAARIPIALAHLLDAHL
jgi:hypothetical protein